MPALLQESYKRLDAPAASSRTPDADWQARWIVAFLLLGVTARLLRFALRFPLWGDESMLALNFVERDYTTLMQPLEHHQVAPLLFLWVELSVVKLLGFNEWALRLFPMLCGLASLLVFHRLARLLFQGTAVVLAVGIFAVSYPALRYTSEVKPYGVDLLVSTILLFLTVRWWKQPGETRRLWLLAAAAPLALGLSFPAIFVAGGVSMATAAVLWKGRSPSSRSFLPERTVGIRGCLTTASEEKVPCSLVPLGERDLPQSSPPVAIGWCAWTAFNLAVVAGFAFWYYISMAGQARAELGQMAADWSDSFPPFDSLGHLLAWLVRVHTGPLLAHPVGGAHWGSAATTLLVLIAVVALARGRSYRLLLLALVPFALNFAAAVLHRYPYGGHMRLAMHLAPIVCLLAGFGGEVLIRALTLTLSRRERGLDARQEVRAASRLNPPTFAAMAILIALAAISMVRDCVLPGKEQQEIRRRDFARWFWGSMERGHEVVCIKSDLGRTFPPPGTPWNRCISPQFLCNARIYSPRRSRGEGPRWDRVSRERPLACVQYWSHVVPYDSIAFGRWLDEIEQNYDLIGCQYYPMVADNDDDRVPEPPDRVEVYQFVPKPRQVAKGSSRP